VEPSRVPPLAVFAALSLVLHAGTYAIAQRAGRPPPTVFEPTTETLAGDTLEVDPTPAEDPAPASEAAPAAQPVAPSAPAVPGRASVAAPATPATHAPHAAAPAPAAAGGAPPAVFGAAGVRYATDLATTFTRGFPQAGSADPVWIKAAFGSTGAADVTLVIDEAGHLTDARIAGAPSPALRSSVERTLALLRPRTFTARGAVTKLRVTARVEPYADVFSLSGGSFSGNVGTAFFALPPSSGPGRRIDVELRLLP
jgi:hypothetical protein